MPFTLQISFHGMCLFVREGAQDPADPQALHVLMPSTDGADEGGCGCEPHTPRLLFDTAHLRPQQTAFDDAMVHCSLLKKTLEIPEGGSALVNALPPELAKLGSVRADVFTGENRDLVASRVLLRNGACSDYAKGTCWAWQNQVRRLSHIIEWSVEDVPGDSLDLPLKWLTGAFAGQVPTLYPVNGVVELEVWHAPHTELPPDCIVPPRPARGGPALHFSTFGRLLESGSVELPAYEPDLCPAIENPGKYDQDDRDRKSAATYSCVNGEAFWP